MTCAKTRVFACFLCEDGKTYTGSNDVLAPQLVCPREAGEGYEKCVSICRQPGHAEFMAIASAINNGSPIRKGRMYVFGNTPCIGCRELMDKNEITYESIP